MQNVQQEITRLHDFFVEWMTGTILQSDKNFAQFTDSISENFYIVAPSGQLTQRGALVERLYHAHNQRHDFSIRVEDVQVRHTFGDVIIATYEEWQKDGNDKITALLSTAVFTIDKLKPNGLLWQCVHETRLPQST